MFIQYVFFCILSSPAILLELSLWIRNSLALSYHLFHISEHNFLSFSICYSPLQPGLISGLSYLQNASFYLIIFALAHEMFPDNSSILCLFQNPFWAQLQSEKFFNCKTCFLLLFSRTLMRMQTCQNVDTVLN